MPRPLVTLSSRLPKGFSDLFLQIAMFFLAYWGYQAVRGIADGKSQIAFAHGEQIISFERSLGAFFEPSLQDAALQHPWLIDAANWMYFNSHFVITMSVLAWLYLFRNDCFYFVRNMFMVAMGLALVGYTVFPTAPPRMFPSAGFTDTIAEFTSVAQDKNDLASFLVNPYAAVPSMHIAFSLMIAGPVVALAKSAWAKAVWSLYPLLVFFVIVVTANHYWFDAAMGAAVACLSAVSAHQLARLRPDAWSWREPAGEEVIAS